MMSSSQNKGIHVNYSTPTDKNPPEGKTTTVIAVMRSKSKYGCHRHCSNKHYKQKIVQVPLDSGSDGNLIFVSKDKPILILYSKRLVPQLFRVGVALIRLGGVNLVFLMVSPEFIALFPMLPDQIPCFSELELLLSLQRFFDLVHCFFIAFLSFPNFLLICKKEFLVVLGFFPPFLAAWKLAFSNLSFSYLQQCLLLCIVYMPHSSCRGCNAMLCKFFGESGRRLSTRSLVSFLALVRSFLVGLCIGLFLCAYTLNSLKSHKKQTHVHGSHAFLVRVEVVLPCKWAHLKNVTCQIILSEWYICRRCIGLGTGAVEPAW
jgi:hypothetical protein